jgi:two-component system, chemotaxis family, CheB/CheR fusion protein
MTRIDEKKSVRDGGSLSSDSSFTESELPDASLLEGPPNASERPLFPIVGVGASAGGVEALQILCRSLPSTIEAAYVVVVHLAPDYESQLASILAKSTAMRVVQVESNITVEPSTVYVIPPRHYLILRGSTLHLELMPQPRPLPRAIDRLFISLAEEQQERAICIVLTGADHDGTVGLKAVKATGGMTIAQLPETAQHPAMPESAIDTGLVDYVLPIEKMGEALEGYINRSRLWQTPPSHEPPAEEIQVLKEIVSLLSSRGGGDFRGYKEGMLMRRTKRRMALLGLPSLDDYATFLKENPPEILALGEDFLIKVTEFFREPAAWKALEQQVIPKILETLSPGQPLRIWVAGCASGEEAYSMGIALLEFISKGGLDIKVNIIGSDLDYPALEAARVGSYPESITTVLKPHLLARYFTRTETGRFVVRKELRERVMFSQHNLIADPPFSHMHLISGRNLLIYLKPEVQDKLLRMFHFALNPEGYLFLGKSETVGECHELFTPVDRQHRIYRALPTKRKVPVKLPLIAETSPTRPTGMQEAQVPRVAYADLVRDLLLKQRSATAVLIDRDGQVLYFYGPTREFLWHPEGTVTRDLLSMVSDEMRVALRAIIHSVRKEDKSGEIVLPPRQGSKGVDRQLRIKAMKAGEESGGMILITFEYETASMAPAQAVNDAESWARRQLEDDLRMTRLDLEASIQALEANNVELRIAHEEALSMNEELQSANEELETSKEELQSVNEELSTVNSDLERAVGQLQIANDDLANLLASSEFPILFLDSELKIKRFTPASRKLFNLIRSDIGRPIGDFASTLEPNDMVSVAREVQDSRIATETEVHARDGHFYLRRILPYFLEEDHVSGVVVTFAPVDTLKQAEQELRESEKRFRTLADTAPVFIWISGLGASLEFVSWRFTNDTGRTEEHLLGVKWHELVHEADLPGYLEVCSAAEAVPKGYDHELRLRKADGSYCWMRFVGVPRFEGERFVGFVGSSVDIQYHKDAEEKLRNADKRKDEFLATLGHELRNPLSPIRSAAQALQLVNSDDPRITSVRETITRQVDHITHLVDDLLDVARLTRGMLSLRIATVDMGEVIRHAVDSTRALMDERRHQLTTSLEDEPLLIQGDSVRLTQIVENLLTNAAKFTEVDGKISLDAHREGEELVVQVKDNGIGIPGRMLPRIFELFTQEERAVRKSSSGLGIGLSLVYQLVALHGGSIHAFSAGPGQGSTFTLRLPLGDIGARQPQIKRSEPVPGDGRILIVDDNVDSADTMAILMTSFGYQVRTAYDSASAVAVAAAFVPQVALLDLSTPEPDGMTLAKRFQQMPETKNTVLIAYSGYGRQEDIEKTRKAGFAHHLVKPVDAEAIHKLIQSMIPAEE